jgi:hypothetical protein
MGTDESMLRLLRRWREGREARAAAQRRNERDFSEHKLPGIGEVTIKTPSHETASQLIDVLRKHGVPAETTRPQGRKVRVPESDGDRRGGLAEAIQMWLMLDSTPNSVRVRCGRRYQMVRRPSGAAESLVNL